MATFHLDNPGPVERETISNPIQIQKNPNFRPDWTSKSRSCAPLVRDKAQHLNRHNKQSQWNWGTLINTVTCNPKTEPKVAKKLKRKSSIPIQIWLSKNYYIQIHQCIGNVARFKSKYMFISGQFRVLGMRKTRKYISCVAIEKLERQVRKGSHCGSKQQ